MATSSPLIIQFWRGKCRDRVHYGPVNLGIGIPNHLTGPPHLASTSCEDADKINKVLRHSIRVQGGSTESGLHFLLSNACLTTAGLVRHYLTALDVDSDVVAGYITSTNLEFSIPVWLEIDNEVINTSFVYSEDDQYLFSHLTRENFQKNSDKTKYLGEDGASGVPAEIVKEAFEEMTVSGNNDNIGKSVTFSLNYGPESLLLYHEEMCDYVKNEFGIGVPDMEEEWRTKCWKCLEAMPKSRLKRCSGCNVAVYCGTKCQKADWKDHRKQHKQYNLG